MRWLRRTVMFIALALTAALAAAAWAEPAMLAYACPKCFGFEAIGKRIYVEKSASAADRRRLVAAVAKARAVVAGFYGSFLHRPVILACKTRRCDRRLGGRGAAGRTYGATFIAFSPRGWTSTIIAHEFSHIVVHDAVGIVAALSGRMPAWFDEGLAVVVSQDGRYLRRSASGALSCRREPAGDLPTGFRDWGRAARDKSRRVYSEAGCKVLRWLGANGGRAALPGVLARMRQGKLAL